MRQKLILTLLLATLVVFSPVTFTGCKSGPARVAYNVESSTQTTVKLALKAWGDYVAKFHPPASDEAKVKTALEKYKAAAILAVDATRFSVSLGSTNAPAASAADTATQAASLALSDLLGVIRSFGVKI